MCQKIEDCLLSKIGFRIFISVVFSIVIIALLLNFQILTGSKVNSVIEENILRKIKDTRTDERSYDKISFDDKQAYQGKNFNRTEKTKILIWIEASKIEDQHFYTKFSHRVRRLRRYQCPILNECIFASNKNKLFRADAVVFVSNEFISTPNHTNDVFFDDIKKEAHHVDTLQFNRNKLLDMRSKNWALLINNPNDQRNKERTIHLMRKVFGITNVDYSISYMPDADIPLLQFRFDSIQSDYENTVLEGTSLLSPGENSLLDIKKRETTIEKLPNTAMSNTALKIRARHSGHESYWTDSQLSLPVAVTRYGAINHDMNSKNIAGHSIVHYDKQRRISNKRYARTTPKSFKNQFNTLQEKNYDAKGMILNGNISLRSKQRRSEGRDSINSRRLAAMIMNDCETEGNREGAYLKIKFGSTF